VLISTVFVHHLTSWIACALLLGWCLVGCLWRRVRPKVPLLVITLTMVVACTAWGLNVGPVLTGYLGPVFRADISGIWSFVTGSAPPRQLFHTTVGSSTILWEKVVDVASLITIVIMIPFAAWDGRRWLREHNGFAVVLGIFGSLFPLLIVTRLVPAASETGDRASGFVYLGLALLFGAWMSRVLIRRPRTRSIVCAGLVFLFIGGIAGGNGPDFERLPGPFLLTADARSADAIALDPAYWLVGRFSPNQLNIAADFDDKNLMAAYGHQNLLTNSGDKVQVSSIFTEPTITPSVRALLRRGDITTVAVDIRMSQYLPVNSVYFEVGEPGDGTYTKPLPKGPLEKFDALPGVSRVFDNGSVRIYDVRSLLKP
jgi:hypothetical protein